MDLFSHPQLATRWDNTDCAPGYKLVSSPDSLEAIAVTQKTYVNLICDAVNSDWPGTCWGFPES
jgi:hypothetical protein